MKICRFKTENGKPGIGLAGDNHTIRDLTPAGITQLTHLLEDEDPVGKLKQIATGKLPVVTGKVAFCAPVDDQEVWAAGVTYLRSKTARMEESDFSATAYDKVYNAARPEIFFKALPGKVVPHGEPVGIRADAKWNVPEPELALVFNSRGKIVGCTIGNDMSSRDIEGENLLYLPQAKTYHKSCSLGPWITLGATEEEARKWGIHIDISREGKSVFKGETAVGQIKRSFDELGAYLFRSQVFPHGAVLLTGTGIVPPDTFTLQAGDMVSIEISGIGMLQNQVAVV